jgi:hypothetical protein
VVIHLETWKYCVCHNQTYLSDTVST